MVRPASKPRGNGSVGERRPERNRKDDSEVEVTDINEEEEVLTYRETITSYGADFPVDGLVKRLKSKAIIIPTFDPEAQDAEVPGFQRQFIWTKSQCDRFVESLLLGLPVPGIFLVRQEKGQLLVLDGQQRLRTLQCFYEGTLRRRDFRLEHVQEQYEGRGYSTLEKSDQIRLDDSIIHATIVKQDEPSKSLNAIYSIFERLNTGGTQLHPQEIRVALYRGNFVELLRELNQDDAWRNLYGKRSVKLKDQELILRFFALLFSSEHYERPMKGFLNDYMEANRGISGSKLIELKKTFVNTTHLINRAIGKKAFRLEHTVNAAVVDSVMVGVTRRLSKGPIAHDVELKRAFEHLIVRQAYVATVERATADEESVSKRLTMATEAFSKVK